MDIEEKKIDGQAVYECPVFTITKDRVLLPNGETATRDRLIHHGGSGVLPLTEDGQVFLVEQFRYGIGQTTWEIPAGKLEKGEDPLVCATRELEEEIGATAGEILPLGTLAVSPAYDSEIIYLYLARDLSIGEQHLDGDEFLNVKKTSLTEALKMVTDGSIIDAKTQIALLKAAALGIR